ncbi:MAG: hypothetical protein LUE09_02340 [Synergistaceae bacterium]|nr:hypothetical protein [Synergistaceae bacterium]
MRKAAVGAGTKETMVAPHHNTNCKLQIAAFLLLLLFTALTAPSAARAAIVPVEPASDDRGVYLLSEPGHLLWFRDTVNDVSADIDAKLTKDIDLSKGGNPSEWIPVGQYTDKTPNGYAGSFDGGGFTVSGYIVASANVVSADQNGKLALAAGFFGLVGPSAEIRGLTVGGVVSVDISNNTDMIYIHAGGIAGVSYGAITDCANGGGVSASGDGTKYTGGIVGDNYGTIANCDHSGGTVSALDFDYNSAGGIAGFSSGKIINCANSGGDVTASGGEIVNNAGGIAGDNIGTIYNSCWPASGDLKAIGSDTAVSADVVSLDAAEMQKVVTTVLPVELTLSVGVGGSAPALISYPGRAGRTIWRATSPSAATSS